MTFIQTHINFVITTLTLISHIAFVVSLLLFWLHLPFRTWVKRVVSENVLVILFVICVGALLGSFTQSLIIGFPPCELCWTQRIMLFIETPLLLWAILKKKVEIVRFLLAFSVIGAAVSLYHSFVQWGVGGSLLGCTSVGGECARVYVLAYNYITIPFMSFTIFAYLITVSLIYLKSRNVGEN